MEAQIELWKVALAVLALFVAIGALLTPIVLAAMARDRSNSDRLNAAISETREAVDRAVSEMRTGVDGAKDEFHSRINRLRDTVTENYVPYRDFVAYVATARGDMAALKADLRADLQRSEATQESRHNEMKQIISSGLGLRTN